MNPVPTLLRDGEGKRICVFTHFMWGDSGPAVYFYDLTVGREVAKASGAQIFLALIQTYSHEFKAYLHLDYKLAKEVVGRNCPIDTSLALTELLNRVEGDSSHASSLSYDFTEQEPAWYIIDINFQQLREKRDMVELIDKSEIDKVDRIMR